VHCRQQKEQQLRELQEQLQILDADLFTVSQGRLAHGGRGQKRTTGSSAVHVGAAAGPQLAQPPSLSPGLPACGPVMASSAVVWPPQPAEGSRERPSSSRADAGVAEPNHEFQQSLSNIAAYKMWRGKKEVGSPDPVRSYSC
jgi:hypothetical protein